MNPVLQKNPSLSLAEAEEQGALAYVNGRIKILKCAPSVLQEVLDLVDGIRSVEQITALLRPKYAQEDIQHFLATLMQSEVLLPRIEQSKEASVLPLVLLGKGLLAAALAQRLQGKPSSAPFIWRQVESLKEWQSSLRTRGHHFLLLCPEEESLGWFMQVNDACMEHSIPFLSLYFNGKNILTGPTVLPGKTPCLACLIEHRRSFMAEKSGLDLHHHHLASLLEARCLKEDIFDTALIDLAAAQVLTEVQKFRQTGIPLTLVRTQLHSAPDPSTNIEPLTFQTISTCPACSGMNRNGLRLGPVAGPLTDKTLRIEERPVVYTLGGRRGLPYAEARSKIDEALRRAGLTVELHRLKTGALDSLLFRYTATIRGRYNTQIPFLIPEDITQRGKGITEEQAYLSAAFELFERICSRYYGNVEMVRATHREVKDCAVDMQALIGETRYQGNMDCFHEDLPVDWVWGYSLVHNTPKLVPASMTYLSEAKFQGHFFDVSSGGLAAGATLEDAILQGLFEVIEHDALIIWQANALTMPKIDLNTIHIPRLRPILKEIEQRGFKVIVRNYTSDFGVPVFRTWIVNERDYRFYATGGLGANLDPDIALERSVSEAWQALVSTNDEEHRHYRCPVARGMVFSYYSLFSLYHFNQREILDEGPLPVDYNTLKHQTTDSVAGDLRQTIAQMQGCIPDADVIVVNLTQEVFDIPVVRVLVSGGVQRFAEPTMSVCRRLFDLPVNMGFRSHKLTFNELFNGPFPH
jgi:oxazoline/thiazoline synthase